MTPHMEAIAFRIWQVAEPKGWDLTVSDLAEMAETTPQYVGKVLRSKGWFSRVRSQSYDYDIPWVDIPASQAARVSTKYSFNVGVWYP